MVKVVARLAENESLNKEKKRKQKKKKTPKVKLRRGNVLFKPSKSSELNYVHTFGFIKCTNIEAVKRFAKKKNLTPLTGGELLIYTRECHMGLYGISSLGSSAVPGYAKITRCILPFMRVVSELFLEDTLPFKFDKKGYFYLVFKTEKKVSF
ncbi:MAG: hypothetical protein WC795_03350 [Candidatus Paceibacterota bacterium]|jgi:hypothetical protein